MIKASGGIQKGFVTIAARTKQPCLVIAAIAATSANLIAPKRARNEPAQNPKASPIIRIQLPGNAARSSPNHRQKAVERKKNPENQK